MLKSLVSRETTQNPYKSTLRDKYRPKFKNKKPLERHNYQNMVQVGDIRL